MQQLYVTIITYLGRHKLHTPLSHCAEVIPQINIQILGSVVNNPAVAKLILHLAMQYNCDSYSLQAITVATQLYPKITARYIVIVAEIYSDIASQLMMIALQNSYSYLVGSDITNPCSIYNDYYEMHLTERTFTEHAIQVTAEKNSYVPRKMCPWEILYVLKGYYCQCLRIRLVHPIIIWTRQLRGLLAPDTFSELRIPNPLK